MTITVQFSNYALKTDETLTQRIQFVYSPLNELFRSLHILLNPRHHGTNIDWVIEIQDRLTDDFYEKLHYFQLFYFTRLTTRFTGSQLTFSLILYSYI